MQQMNEEIEFQPGGQLWADIGGMLDLLPSAPAEAARQARSALKLLPGQPNAVRLLVDALRLQGDIAGARAELESLVAELPDLAVLHHELGLLLSELGDRDGAIRALSRVVELEPRHSTAWRSLGEELAAAGNLDAAANAFAKQFESSIVDLKMLETMYARGTDRDEIAANMFREYLKIYPTDVYAIQMMGRLYMQAHLFEAAENIFARASELAPDFTSARQDHLAALHQQHKWQTKNTELDKLLELEPDNLDYRFAKATALLQLADYPAGVRLFEELVRDHPDNAVFWTSYANALRSVGRKDEAVTAFRTSVRLRPDIGYGWWGLADLMALDLSESDIDTIQTQLARKDLVGEHRYYLHFALGEIFEAKQRFAPAFEHFSKGNALRRAELPYNADEMTSTVKRQKRHYTAEFFHARAGSGCQNRDPIFILGMARSGSTLVEQILSSHSSIDGAGELPTLANIATRIEIKDRARAVSGEGDRPALADEDLRALGEEYLATSRIYRKLARPVFTDKAPMNFHHVALICAALPNAKIIDVRRHPLACCFSNFKQLFPWGLPQTYDLADIGRYYRDYVELMAHFDAVLPGRVHRVIYEELVHDTEKEARRLFDYCGLPFEPQSLRFYENQRGVVTVSSEQVRQPIFAQANEQWRHYDQWLGPLKAALGSLPDIYPAVPDHF
jgi:tetratricopeptide (TPR) repeat protein